MADRLKLPYRKLYPAFWRDEKVQLLEPLEKLMAAYLITGPQTNRIGLYYLNDSIIQEDLRMPRQQMARTLVSVREKMGWEREIAYRILYIPSWWEWNEPENVNQFKGCLKDTLGLPRCELLEKFLCNTAFLSNSFFHNILRNLSETLLKGSPIQVQEQEQRQVQEQKQKTFSPSGEGKSEWLGKFPDFWKSVHGERRLEKREAVKEWGLLCPPQEQIQSLAGRIVAAAAAYYSSKDPNYMLYPARFLKKRRWEDEANVGNTNQASSEHSRGTGRVSEADGGVTDYGAAFRSKMQPVRE